MKCPIDDFETDNKKSYSSHMRWHKGIMSPEMYRGINKGKKNGQWKGNRVGYSALHDYIKYHLAKPKTCQKCGKEKTLDLANISQEYKRELSDWEWLCRSCHMISDGRLDNLHNRVYPLKENHALWKGVQIKIPCEFCGNEFTRRYMRTKCCSSRCGRLNYIRKCKHGSM